MAAVPPDSSEWFGVTLLFVLYGALVAVMLILATNCANVVEDHGPTLPPVTTSNQRQVETSVRPQPSQDASSAWPVPRSWPRSSPPSA